MKIIGVTYADERMTKSQDLCMLSMEKNGVDKVYGVNSSHWSAWEHTGTFNRMNSDILKQKRGSGYWLWKPWSIANVMNLHCKDGDILIYSDAGIEWLQPVREIIDRMDEDIFFFTNGFPHVEWCKADVAHTIIPGLMAPSSEVMKAGTSDDYIRNFKQVQASVIFFKVGQKTRDFVKEWLLWCQMPGFIDDSPSKFPNYPTFAEHRHDQAILTCLQIKYGYKLHFWPTNYSEHIRHTAQPGDTYPTMFNHHRKRNTGMGDGDAEW